MVVVALLSVDLVESVDLVLTVLAFFNPTLLWSAVGGGSKVNGEKNECLYVESEEISFTV